MRITRDADYAVRLVVDLAGRPAGKIVSTRVLARSTGTPAPYLAKVVQALARAGVVSTRQGPAGGVQLGRDAAAITLREVIESIEGPILVNRCVEVPSACPRDAFCTVHPVWQRIQSLLVRELESVTVKDLATRPERAPA